MNTRLIARCTGPRPFDGACGARVVDGKTKTRVVGWVFKDYLNCNIQATAQTPQQQPTYPTGGGGTFETGNDWLKLCGGKSNDRSLYVARCYAYPRGLADGLSLWAYVDPEGAQACIPNEVTSEQLLEIGVNFIANNPKDRHNGSGLLLAGAFRQAYPCETDEAKPKGKDRSS
jgi:hypothetical protein